MDVATDQSEQDRIAAVIAEQNDQFRKTWGADFTVPGRIVMTRGVADLGYAEQAQIMQAVQQYNDFTEDNDPYGQHDFGVFTMPPVLPRCSAPPRPMSTAALHWQTCPPRFWMRCKPEKST